MIDVCVKSCVSHCYPSEVARISRCRYKGEEDNDKISLNLKQYTTIKGAEFRFGFVNLSCRNLTQLASCENERDKQQLTTLYRHNHSYDITNLSKSQILIVFCKQKLTFDVKDRHVIRLPPNWPVRASI